MARCLPDFTAVLFNSVANINGSLTIFVTRGVNSFLFGLWSTLITDDGNFELTQTTSTAKFYIFLTYYTAVGLPNRA